MASIIVLGKHVHPPVLEVRRIKREIQSLIGGDPSRANAMLGAIASIEEDVAEARRRYSSALALDPYNTTNLVNYAVTLGQMGFFSEACEQAHRTHELAPSNVALLDALIVSLARAGRFVEA